MSVLDLSPFNNIISRLEGVADRLEAATAGGAAPAVASSAAPASDEPAIAIALDAYIKEHVEPFKAAAAATGAEDLKEATEVFCTALGYLRDLLVASARCAKPADADWQKFLGPIMELGKKAQQACDNRSDFFQNRKSIAEAINIAMLVMNPSPPSHVQNVLESMDFHAMKVMQKKVDAETAWIKGLKAAIKALQEWCNDNCKLGLTWKAGGESAVAYFETTPLGSAKSAAPAAGAKGKGKGKAPPPPKGGFAPKPVDTSAPKAPAGPGMGAVFGDLKNFSTGGLKKVSDDQKTHKMRPEDKLPALIPKAKPAAAPVTRKGENAKGPRGEPRLELEKDRNWMIENYADNQDLTIEDINMQQLLIVINCRNCTVKVGGKVKSICMDGCEKVTIICNDVLSTVELVNSNKAKVQTLGCCNSFAIDKCDGVNIKLSKASLGAEIIASKSSEMNVTIPEEGGDEYDFVEMPIPEQFVTTIAGPKKLKTEVSHIYG